MMFVQTFLSLFLVNKFSPKRMKEEWEKEEEEVREDDGEEEEEREEGEELFVASQIQLFYDLSTYSC